MTNLLRIINNSFLKGSLIQKSVMFICWWIIHIMFIQILPFKSLKSEGFSFNNFVKLDNSSSLLGLLSNLSTPIPYLKSINISHLTNIPPFWLTIIFIECIILKIAKFLGFFSLLWLSRIVLAQVMWSMFNLDFMDWVLTYFDSFISREQIYSWLNDYFFIPILGTSLTIVTSNHSDFVRGIQGLNQTVKDGKAIVQNTYKSLMPSTEELMSSQLSNDLKETKNYYSILSLNWSDKSWLGILATLGLYLGGTVLMGTVLYLGLNYILKIDQVSNHLWSYDQWSHGLSTIKSYTWTPIYNWLYPNITGIGTTNGATPADLGLPNAVAPTTNVPAETTNL